MTIGTMQMNGGGPTPTGKWVDVRTGDVRTVKTMVDDMSGGGATIMFIDGNVIPFSEFSMYYIQESDVEEHEQVIAETTSSVSSQPKLNRDLLMKGLEPVEEEILLDAGTERKPFPINNQTRAPKVEEISKQKQLVLELFDKAKEYPTIDAENILIKNIPTDALRTLHDYFDVTVDDIADILMEKCIDKSALRQSVINNINSILDT